jgi:heme/copper-type cytochrome/quinol oxidase subunit 2
MYYILYCVSPIINRIIVIVTVIVIVIAIAIAITTVTIYYYYYDHFNPKKSKEYHHQQHFVIELK